MLKMQNLLLSNSWSSINTSNWLWLLDSDDISLLEDLLWSSFYSVLLKLSSFWHSIDDLSVFDFDETICHRFDTFQHSIFVENRWDQWNIALLKYWWIEKYIDYFYFLWKPSKTMIDLVRAKSSMILTAWIKELQLAKINAVWLSDIPKVVVDSWKDKPLRLLKYILDLWYIPTRIDIYEDRPEYFLKYWKVLSKLLRTDIYIHHVCFQESEKDPILLSQTWHIISSQAH